MPDTPRIDVEEELKDLERVVLNFPDPRMVVVYEHLRGMANDDGFELPPFLTGRPLPIADYDALELDEQVAHRMSEYLHTQLASESTSRRRLLVLRELIELRRAHFLHEAPSLGRLVVYGIDADLLPTLDPDKFSNLLMLMALGRV